LEVLGFTPTLGQSGVATTVEVAFSTFDITMKSNNLTSTTLDDLNKCKYVNLEVVVFFYFMPFDDKHDGHICI
jgi:riboflavin synthase alpha subunit